MQLFQIPTGWRIVWRRQSKVTKPDFQSDSSTSQGRHGLTWDTQPHIRIAFAPQNKSLSINHSFINKCPKKKKYSWSWMVAVINLHHWSDPCCGDGRVGGFDGPPPSSHPEVSPAQTKICTPLVTNKILQRSLLQIDQRQHSPNTPPLNQSLMW